MKTGVLKFLGACAAALAFAMPASAFTVSLNVVGQNLEVSLVDLNGATINAYDVFVTYDPSLASGITGVIFSSELGDPNDILQTLSFSDTATDGTVEAGVVSFLPNTSLQASQTDPLLLFTVRFNDITSLLGANFAVGGGSTFGCAAVDPTGGNNPNYSVSCSPGGSVPEPATLALAAVALAGAGFARRRRAGLVAA